jgi:hypothetical protein
LPVLKEIKCPATADLACKLSGTNLFLVDSVSADPGFEHSVKVPDGFPGYALPVPHPSNGLLYVKLRDDPAVVSRATLVTQQLPPSPEEATRADVRHAAGDQSHTATQQEPPTPSATQPAAQQTSEEASSPTRHAAQQAAAQSSPQ